MNEYQKMKYINVLGDEVEVYLVASTYCYSNTIYLGIICAEEGVPYADLTVNLNNYSSYLKKNEGFIDTNNTSHALEFIDKYKLGKYTDISMPSGYCSYPLYEFDMNEIAKYCDISEIV